MRRGRLRLALEAIERSFGPGWLGSDPVEIVRRFSAPEDREVAAFFASALAYGNVVQIRRSVEEALRRMEGRPRAFLDRLDRPRARRAFEGFVHRFHPHAAPGRDSSRGHERERPRRHRHHHHHRGQLLPERESRQ